MDCCYRQGHNDFHVFLFAPDGIRAIDWGQQGKIPAGLIQHTVTECYGILVLFEPRAVVDHPTQEGLLRPVVAAMAGYTTTVFGSVRDSGCPLPPAQTRAGAIDAHGSHLGRVAAKRTLG